MKSEEKTWISASMMIKVDAAELNAYSVCRDGEKGKLGDKNANLECLSKLELAKAAYSELLLFALSKEQFLNFASAIIQGLEHVIKACL